MHVSLLQVRVCSMCAGKLGVKTGATAAVATTTAASATTAGSSRQPASNPQVSYSCTQLIVI